MIHFNLIILTAVTAVTLSCGQVKPTPESMTDIKGILAKLDSAITEIPGQGAVAPSIDSLVARITGSADIEEQAKDMAATRQGTRDKARASWNKFKSLCDSDKYGEALDFYLGDNADGEKTAGDFLVFLGTSTHRFTFFSLVLMPMMIEYKGYDFALEKYIDTLQMEKEMEDLTIAMHSETNGYVPDVYPFVIEDLGTALVYAGKIDEAKELTGDYIQGIYSLSGNILLARLKGAYYTADLFVRNEDPKGAISSWESFKSLIERNKKEIAQEDYAQCMEIINKEINKLTEQ